MPPQRRSLLCLAAVLLLLGGCASLERVPPRGLTEGDRILVFADSMHSGLVVTKTPALSSLDPQVAGDPAGLPCLEVGFAADEWVSANEPGSGMKLRLAFGSSRGVLALCHLPGLARPPRAPDAPLKTWNLAISAEGRRRLDACILSWVNPEAPVLLRPPERPTTGRFTRQRWSIFHNCHDFTVLCLRAAGLDLAVRSLYDNDRFRDQLDAALGQLETNGITVIGPVEP